LVTIHFIQVHPLVFNIHSIYDCYRPCHSQQEKIHVQPRTPLVSVVGPPRLKRSVLSCPLTRGRFTSSGPRSDHSLLSGPSAQSDRAVSNMLLLMQPAVDASAGRWTVRSQQDSLRVAYIHTVHAEMTWCRGKEYRESCELSIAMLHLYPKIYLGTPPPVCKIVPWNWAGLSALVTQQLQGPGPFWESRPSGASVYLRPST
jgi:hypothetical protein